MGKNSNRKRRREGGTGEPVVFDPEARSAYLRGFSKRKEERRAYGLAMQKVKDRRARLEQRAELKQAERERVEEAERHKQLQMEAAAGAMGLAGLSGAAAPSGGDRRDEEAAGTGALEKVETYEDEQTRTMWGGEVIVTTSSRVPGGTDGDGDDEGGGGGEGARAGKKRRRNVDAEQEYAGNVEKYLSEMIKKAKLPSKKRGRDARGTKQHKGLHGASNMKGIAGSGDIKVAKRALDRFQQKGAGKSRQHPAAPSSSSRGGGGSRRKRR